MIYLQSLKKNMYLLLITVVLLILTFGWWFGIPIFKMSVLFMDLGISETLTFILVSISIGIFFSLYWVPINAEVAKVYAAEKSVNKIIIYFKFQAIFILVTSAVVAIIIYTFTFLTN